MKAFQNLMTSPPEAIIGKATNLPPSRSSVREELVPANQAQVHSKLAARTSQSRLGIRPLIFAAVQSASAKKKKRGHSLPKGKRVLSTAILPHHVLYYSSVLKFSHTAGEVSRWFALPGSNECATTTNGVIKKRNTVCEGWRIKRTMPRFLARQKTTTGDVIMWPIFSVVKGIIGE